MKKKRILGGNRTRIDPKDHLESYYITNAVTQTDDVLGNTTVPLRNERNVIQAKHFVDRNHK